MWTKAELRARVSLEIRRSSCWQISSFWKFTGQEAGAGCSRKTPCGCWEVRTCFLTELCYKRGTRRHKVAITSWLELVLEFFCVFWIIVILGSKQHKGSSEHAQRVFLGEYLKCVLTGRLQKALWNEPLKFPDKEELQPSHSNSPSIRFICRLDSCCSVLPPTSVRSRLQWWNHCGPHHHGDHTTPTAETSIGGCEGTLPPSSLKPGALGF